MHAPAAVTRPFDDRPKGTERSRRRRHVLALQKPADAGLPHRERAKHEHAVRDGFVAGHGASSPQRTGSRRDQGVRLVLSGAILAARAWHGHGVGHDPSLAQRWAASSGADSIENLILTGGRQTGIGDGHDSPKKQGGTGVAKREWGAKHTCMSCGGKFYDLHRNPITCPKCGTEAEVETARPNRRRP